MIADKRRLLGKYTTLFAILAIALGVKAWLVFSDVVPFNSDEAVVALMARHILSGEQPLFFYGQAYMGSLDAYLIAAGFWIFGQQVWVIRLIQTLLYGGVIVTTYLLGKEGFKSEQAGIIAALIMAVPNVNVTLYTTATLGGYGEALLIGNLILLAGLRIANLFPAPETPADSEIAKDRTRFIWIVALGFLTGFGLWVFGLTLIYSVPTWLYILWRLYHSQRSFRERGKDLIFVKVAGVVGFLAGSFPWWFYAIQYGLRDLVVELTGSAVAVESAPYVVQVFNHLLSYLLLGITVTLGLRPPWEVRWLALPLMPLILFIWCAVIVYAIRRIKRPSTRRPVDILLLGLIAFQAGAFLFTSFGADPSGRYFIPLAIPLALFAADFIVSMPRLSAIWKWAIVALLLVDHGWGIAQSAAQYPPGITTQFGTETKIDHRYDGELLQFLKDRGVTRGYSNYWVAYPLAFLSQEEIIFVPRLPYHLDFRYTPRDDRYSPYAVMIRSSEQVAFITTLHPALDDRLRSAFTERSIRWQEEVIGDYRVFYDLSSPISPEDIGLGEGTS